MIYVCNYMITCKYIFFMFVVKRKFWQYHHKICNARFVMRNMKVNKKTARRGRFLVDAANGICFLTNFFD